MKQTDFEVKYKKSWEDFETVLEKLEKRKGITHQDHEAFLKQYYSICHQLSIVRERNYGQYHLEFLNNLALRGHKILYQRKSNSLSAIISFLSGGFPALIKENAKWVFASLFCFLFSSVGMWVLTRFSPELVYNVFEPAQVNAFEYMYSSSAVHIGSERTAENDFQMFGYYIYNNISVSFRAYASGILWGVGSIITLIFNGVIFGTLAAHLDNIGFSETFYSFVIGHGSFEITAIIFSGGAGLKLGFSLIAPGALSRVAALRKNAKSTIPIIYGVIGMLVIAAVIEAFWSSSAATSTETKLYVGACLWGFVLFYFIVGGRQNGSQ